MRDYKGTSEDLSKRERWRPLHWSDGEKTRRVFASVQFLAVKMVCFGFASANHITEDLYPEMDMCRTGVGDIGARGDVVCAQTFYFLK